MQRSGVTRDGRAWSIRPYRPEDRAGVRHVCCETGFIGRPQEAVFHGRELFADLWSSYWTDYEPENAFVVDVGGHVEGYLLGCLDTRRQMKAWNRWIVPKVAATALATGWWLRAINRRYLVAMTRSALHGETTFPLDEILAEYPAHLHTNIADPTLRGEGIGKALMLTWIERLQEAGVAGVHLGTTSHNREAVPFYEHMGFRILHRKRATWFDHVIEDPPLFTLYMGKKLR